MVAKQMFEMVVFGKVVEAVVVEEEARVVV